jgi:hypothetical protein
VVIACSAVVDCAAASGALGIDGAHPHADGIGAGHDPRAATATLDTLALVLLDTEGDVAASGDKDHGPSILSEAMLVTATT